MGRPMTGSHSAIRSGSRRVWIGVGIAVLVLSQGAFAAWAATTSSSASDSGGTIRVGAASQGSTPGRTTPRRPTGSGSSGSTCTYVPLPARDAATISPGGPTPGSWFFVRCPGRNLTIYNGAISWFPSAPATASPTSVAPSTLATRAEGSLTLPSPALNLNPSEFSIVNLATWLWIDPQIWRPFRASATAGAVTATATAVPSSVSWSMGDGHTLTCNGPGSPYRPTTPPDAQVTDCSYIYQTSSAGQPSSDGDPNDDAYAVTATITWTVTWTTTGSTGGGALPSLQTSSTTRVRVEQVESVGTSG